MTGESAEHRDTDVDTDIILDIDTRMLDIIECTIRFLVSERAIRSDRAVELFAKAVVGVSVELAVKRMPPSSGTWSASSVGKRKKTVILRSMPWPVHEPVGMSDSASKIDNAFTPPVQSTKRRSGDPKPTRLKRPESDHVTAKLPGQLPNELKDEVHVIESAASDHGRLPAKSPAVIDIVVANLLQWFGTAKDAMRALDRVQHHAYGRKASWLSKLESMAVKEGMPAPRPDGSIRKPGYAVVPGFPVVRIEESVKPDGIICLADGQKRSMISRYIAAKYGLSPEEYRCHFGLPEDYPMVCDDYRSVKERQAKNQGLGHWARSNAGVRDVRR